MLGLGGLFSIVAANAFGRQPTAFWMLSLSAVFALLNALSRAFTLISCRSVFAEPIVPLLSALPRIHGISNPEWFSCVNRSGHRLISDQRHLVLPRASPQGECTHFLCLRTSDESVCCLLGQHLDG